MLLGRRPVFFVVAFFFAMTTLLTPSRSTSSSSSSSWGIAACSSSTSTAASVAAGFGVTASLEELAVARRLRVRIRRPGACPSPWRRVRVRVRVSATAQVVDDDHVVVLREPSPSSTTLPFVVELLVRFLGLALRLAHQRVVELLRDRSPVMASHALRDLADVALEDAAPLGLALHAFAPAEVRAELAPALCSASRISLRISS